MQLASFWGLVCTFTIVHHARPGNIGNDLSIEVQEAQTYLSRDGGWSWSQVNKWTIQI
jgi:hypothetical protein